MHDKDSIWKRNAWRLNHADATVDAPAFCRGFTLIELLVVIAIIGILAAIAIPNFLTYRQSGYDAMAKSDAKNSYDAARAYFIDYPVKIFSGVADLNSYGFRNSDDVTLTVTGNANTLSINARHLNGSRTFTVDATGKLNF